MESAPKIENENELPQEKSGFGEQAILGVNEYLQKEAERTGEKFPPVFIKFFSGAHATEYDAGGIPKELEDADIYMPELYGWEEDVAQEFNVFLSGKFHPKTHIGRLPMIFQSISTQSFLKRA